MRTMLLSLALAVPIFADPPAGKPIDPPPAQDLEKIIRSMATAALPSPLIDQKLNWGRQKMVANGITWEKDGFFLKPKTQEKLKNDGTWRKVKVEAVDPEKNLTVQVLNLKNPEKGKLTFDVLVTLPVKIQFEQQIWKAGLRLYSGETRAKCRPILGLRCESTSKVVKTGSLLPDVTFRLRVLDAKLSYDQFKVEHTAGLGGEAAEIIGNALHDTITQAKPSLEKNMLERANKAIIKAGDTKEIKLGLGKLFEGK